MIDLFTPPRYFRNVKFHRHTDRAVGWLELFYDLVYVATLIQIGNFLSDNLTLLGFGQFIVMMTVVWWAWTGETFYQNRFAVDDWQHRFLVFTQMFGVATLGLSVSGAFGDLYVQFTLAYVVVRLMTVLMFVRVWVLLPEHRLFSRNYILGFSLGIMVWLGSLLLPAEIHWVGWLVGISIELIVPLIPAIAQNRLPVDNPHITERYGIFTIIVLGESFVKILEDGQGQVLNFDAFLFSVGGLTVVYSLWWLYFSDTAGKLVDTASERKSVTWLYGHLPLAASLVAFGVGAKKLFAEVYAHPGDPLKDEYRLLYTTSIVMFMVALALIDYGLDDSQTAKSQINEALSHLVGAVVVVIIGLTFTGATAIQFVWLIAVVMIAKVAYSVVQVIRAGEEGAARELPHGVDVS